MEEENVQQHHSLEPHNLLDNEEDEQLSDDDRIIQMNQMEVVQEACATGDEESLDYP